MVNEELSDVLSEIRSHDGDGLRFSAFSIRLVERIVDIMLCDRRVLQKVMVAKWKSSSSRDLDAP
jgi:hypothetical protein